jgi:hypothetical protein
MEIGARPVSGGFGSLLVGAYTWIVVAAFGAVLLDVVYASGIRAALEPSQAARLFNEPADFLGLLFGVSIVAAVAALAAAWHTKARNFLIGSALIVLGTPFVAVLVGPVLAETQAGSWLRIALSGAASVLGLFGLGNVYRRV